MPGGDDQRRESATAGSGSHSSQSGSAWPSAHTAITAQPVEAAREEAERDHVADHRADAEGREQRSPRSAGWWPNRVEHEHGNGDEERLPRRVADREDRPPDPEQPVAAR